MLPPRRPHHLAPWLLALLAPTLSAVPPAGAQLATPELVADLETAVPALPLERDSAPVALGRIGGFHLFLADDGRHGREPWRSDGTAAGTERLADLCPGRCGVTATQSLQTPFAVVDDRLFLTGSDGTGQALFVSDGTPEGTRLVRRLPSLFPWGSAVGYEGRFYFTVFATGGRTELWRSDGTAAGTGRFCDTCEVLAHGLTVFDASLFFITVKPAGERELWRTDGTLEGTRAVHASLFCASCWDSRPFVAGDRLFFARYEPAYGIEPWVLDAASGIPRLLADVLPGPQSSFAFGAFAWRGAAYMNLESSPGVRGWYRSDGDKPALVGALQPYGPSRPAHVAFPAGDVLFFTVWNGTANELWALGPGEQGGRRVADGFEGLVPLATLSGLTAGGDRGLFAVGPAAGPLRVWSSDGTAAGTFALGELQANYATPPPVAATGGPDVLLSLDGGEGFEPWTSDGTPAGTRSLGDLKARASSDPGRLTALADKVYFQATLGDLGYPTRLYTAGGGAPGATAIEGVPAPRELAATARGLVVTDGVQLAAVDAASDAALPLPAPLGPFRLVSWAGRVAFGGFDEQSLWLSDGTVAGTAELVDIGDSVNYCNFTCPGSWPTYPQQLTAAGGALYFVGSPPESSTRLFRTDGSPEGTVAAPLPEGLDFLDAEQILALGETAVGVSRTWRGSVLGSVLWLTDAAGTRTLLTVDVPLVLLGAAGGRVLFARQDPGGDVLWTTDGSAAGTSPVAPLAAPGSGARVTTGPTHHDPDAIAPRERSVVAGERLFFAVADPAIGEEPWVSDGTAAGTRPLIDLRPGIEGSHPTDFASHGACALFAASDGTRGHELWGSDGDRTFLVADIAPGRDGSSPSGMALAGDRLYFAADDGVHGREPWTLATSELDALCAQPAPPLDAIWMTTPQVPGFRFAVRVEHETRSGLVRVPGTALACTPGTLCVTSGSAGRVELVARILPRRRGILWPLLAKLTPNAMEVWIEQMGSDLRRYYRLPATPLAESRLAGVLDRVGFTAAPAASAAPEPAGPAATAAPWLVSPTLPGYRVQVRIGAAGTEGRLEPCVPSALCASGAQRGRAVVFVRVLGPKPTGTLRPAIARLTPERVEVTVQRLRDGATRTYVLPAVPAGSTRLDGHLDPAGFPR